MPDRIVRNGSPEEYEAEWWVQRPDGDITPEISDNGYDHSFTLGECGETFEVEVYSRKHFRDDPPDRPAILLLVNLCGAGEFIFCPDWWEAVQFLQKVAPLVIADLLTTQAQERAKHLEEHVRKSRWDSYCFWCAHEKRCSS